MALVRIIARDRRDLLGEGPLWSGRDNVLWWVDILGQRLNRLSLADDRVECWDMPQPIGWVIEREHAAGLVAGFHSGVALLDLDPFDLNFIAIPEPNKPTNRLNDAKADACGRIWAGTMPMAGQSPEGALYRLDPGHRIVRVDQGYCIANGPAISPDGRWLYHTDTRIRMIYRFVLDEDGTLGPREPFLRFEEDWGFPDGMTFDAEGGLWIAHWGAGCISRFDTAGRRQRSISLPASQITSCAFGGKDFDRMFVTSAADGVTEEYGGALFEVDPGVTGLAAGRFGG